MSDDQAREPVRCDPEIRLVIDQLGDPFLYVDVTMPPDGAAPVDAVEKLALDLLAAVAGARTRAAIVRKQLFAGIPPQEAVQFTHELMD